MKQEQIVVTPSVVRKMVTNGIVVGMNDDFVIARQLKRSGTSQLSYPFRIESYIVIYCFEGTVTCSVNLNEYTLTRRMMLIVTPGNIVKVSSGTSGSQEECFTIINVTVEFFKDIGFDPSEVIIEATQLLQSPCMTLAAEEETLLGEHIDLICDLLTSGTKYMRESIISVMLSVFYLFAGFMHKSHAAEIQQTPVSSSRQRAMFEKFMKLVAEKHDREHLMKYYADQLCVTPKYLSKVVKDVSGKSGPEWIDEFIILSAKNMLRHSDTTIKEISEKLNFQNHSFFFRFFKNHTGLTPSQYRQS